MQVNETGQQMGVHQLAALTVRLATSGSPFIGDSGRMVGNSEAI
jgi:hypothetical protein